MWIIIFAAGIIPIFLLHFLVINTYESNLITRRTSEIRQRVHTIASDLSKTAQLSDSLTADNQNNLSLYADAYGGRVVVINPMYSILYDSYSADTGRMVVSDAVFSAFSGKEFTSNEHEAQLLEFVVPITYTENDVKSITGVLVFSSTTSWLQESLQKVEHAMLIIEAILIFILILASTIIVIRIGLPIRNASMAAVKMSAGALTETDFSQVHSYPEIDAIVDNLADVVEHYQALEQMQEQFVSNVSHELRTPMTSIRVLADSLVGQQGIPEELYQEFMGDISKEIDREARIIEDLLSMTRLSNQNGDIAAVTVNINDFLMTILKTLKPLAESRNIDLIYESFREVRADIDETKLNQAISNIIENAIKYDNDGGWVRVSLDADHEYFYIRV
ncbi:MAG: HAMP domain-containing histidine kinase, partial [Lachnospiraceae bacterium]|nr:HAMP domain-containing histidine kinase [Lachnospiraceae bacterium]